MKTGRRTALLWVLTLACAIATPAKAQENALVRITAKVHGTFVDKAGGLGVLYGEMHIIGFEVRNGTIMAIGRVGGALADSAGTPLGRVKRDITLPVSNVASTCIQLQMQLGAVEEVVLQTVVKLDEETAGLDSRQGTAPKSLGPLCAVAELLKETPTPESLASALNAVVVAIEAR